MRPPLLALTVLLACAPTGSPVEQFQRGDTTIVRTIGDGAWGAIGEAVEEHRAGADGGPTPFGQATSALVLPSGGVLIFDAMGPALRLFDPQGRFVGTIGGPGMGKGEFGARAIASLAAAPDGSILLLDPRNGRVTRYASNGSPLSPIPIGPACKTGSPYLLRPGRNGSVYVSALIRPVPCSEEGARGATGYIHYDSTGSSLDTIQVPQLWFPLGDRPGAAPSNQWAVLSDGRVLATRTDRLGFLLKGLNGSNKVLMAEVATEPAPLGPEERSELQAEADFWENQSDANRILGSERPAVPTHLPVSGNALIDFEGRIWIERYVASIKTAPYPAQGVPGLTLSYVRPTVWSAFRMDGTYLGDIRFPSNSRVFGFLGNRAWAIVRDTADQQFLVRYQIGDAPLH